MYIIANTTYFDPLPQERVFEEMTFEKPYDDKELRRINPKRYDDRTDWLELNNEKGHDSDVSNRYSSLSSSVLLYKLEYLYNNPSKNKIMEYKSLLKNSNLSVKSDIYDYVQNQLDSIDFEYSRGIINVSSVIKHFVLYKLFEF
jgi:hypothetical protein